MNAGFEALASPQLRRVAEELDHQACAPEHKQSQRHFMPQPGMKEVIGSTDAECAHEKDHQCNKKGMDVHHLPVDEAERTAFLFPVEAFREHNMDDGQHDHAPAGNIKM